MTGRPPSARGSWLGRVLPAAVLVLLAAGDAGAYGTITSPASTWRSGEIPVPWSLNQRGSDDIGIDATEVAVQNSFDTWQNVDCCAIAFDYRGRTALTAGSSSGTNVISWSESGWGYGSSAIAVTQDWFGSGTIEEADIDCNGVYLSWNTTGAGGGVDTQSILTHEIGHFLGLGDLYDGGHASSTMYGVYSGGTGSRSLAEDDMAGCRALYADACGGCTVDTDCPSGYHCDASACVRNTTAGNMCDPCSSPADCTDGLCLSFPEPHSGTFCGVNCSTDAECGAGNQCFPISGASSQCAPADGDCTGGSSGCTVDTDCPSGYHCDAGACVADEPVPECTVDTDCGAGRRCAGGTCVAIPPTLHAFGEPCASGGECGSNMCLDGYCTQSCSAYHPLDGCPGGTYCDNISCGEGRCRAGAAGPGEIGAACGGDSACESAYCDTSAGPGACMEPCNPSETFNPQCQYGEACQPWPSANCGVCLCGGGMFGDPCTSDADCMVGVCRTAGTDDVSRCTTDCPTGACPFGATCTALTAPDGTSEMRCAATGQRLGGRCTDRNECQSGFCWNYSDYSFCSRPCGGICNCPQGLTCVSASDGNSYCVPTGIASGDDGCGCRAPGAPSAHGLLGLLGLALLFGLRSVRRRG